MSTGHKHSEKKDDQKVEPIQRKIESDGRGKPNRKSPRNRTPGAEGRSPVKNCGAGIAPRCNGTESLPLCSPNDRTAGHKVTQASVIQEVIHDSDAVDIQEWRICDLKQHPKQDLFFPGESEEADRELEADMQAKGQQTPIERPP